MKCQKDYDLVGYFNNEISAAERAEIEEHLVSCSDCRRELIDIKETILSLNNLPEIEPSPDFTSNVIDYVKSDAVFSSLPCAIGRSASGGKEYAPPISVVSEQESIGLWDILKYYLRRSPPWAVSAALHVMVFAVLTFIFVNQTSKSFSPYIGNRWANIYLPKESDIEEHKTVSDSAASAPLSEFKINQKELINKISQGDDKIIKHIVNRIDEDNRKELLSKYNGTETVQAVSQGMKWLARSQEEGGNWAPSESGGRDEYTAALTGLAILCFTGQGNSHLNGDFSQTVNKSVKYLISVQQPNGHISNSLPADKPVDYPPDGRAGMYNHGIATYALLEDYLIAHNYPESEGDELTKALGDAIIKAVSFIVQAQSNNGGWGYFSKSPVPDTSVTVWQIQALRLAAILDMPGVEYALYKSRQWLCDVTSDNGLVGYQSLLDYPNGPYALTAAGSTAYLWIDSLPVMKSDKEDDVIKKRLDGLHKKQIALLTENLPGDRGISIENDFYYCYWGSMAMISPDNPEWGKWNAQIKEILIKNQSETGNWQVNDKWGMFGGQLYTTTMAILTLQVYYRYPPMTVKSS